MSGVRWNGREALLHRVKTRPRCGRDLTRLATLVAVGSHRALGGFVVWPAAAP